MKTNGDKNISVLILVDRAVGGTGPHRNVVGSLNALSGRIDINVILYCGNYDHSEPFAMANNIRFHCGYNPKSFLKVVTNLLTLFWLSLKCDVIYVPCGFISALYGSLARCLLNRKLVLGPNVSKFPFRKIDAPGFFEVGLLADKWLEASRRRRDHVLKHLCPRLHEKVTNILHSIDLVKFNPKHRSMNFFSNLNIRKDSIKILHVGRDNEPIKGVPVLLDVINILNRDFMVRDKIDFIIAGKMSETTRKLAQKNPNVHFLGFLSGKDLSTAFASSDFTVVPSSWENCPFTVLEALASGLPVIAFNTGGIPELVDSQVNGILVDGIDSLGRHNIEAAEKLAAAILSLLMDSTRRAEMSRAARASAESKFSEDRLGNELVLLFRQVKNSC